MHKLLHVIVAHGLLLGSSAALAEEAPLSAKEARKAKKAAKKAAKAAKKATEEAAAVEPAEEVPVEETAADADETELEPASMPCGW